MEEQLSSSSSILMDVQERRTVIQNIKDNLQGIKFHCLHAVDLSQQWRSLQASFAHAHASLEKELEEKNREFLAEREIFVGVRRKMEEERECVLARVCAVEKTENDVNERFIALVSKEKEIEDRLGVLESKEREIEEQFGVVKSREKKIEDCFGNMESREKEIEERFGVVELREKEIEERIGVCMRKEREFEERFEVLGWKEDDIEERSKVVATKEKEIGERFGVVESREKEIDERIEVLESKEKGIEERSKVVGSKEKKIVEGLNELNLKEKELSERCERLDFKDKQVDWCLKELELKKKRVDERCEALKLRERQLNEGCPAPIIDETQVRIWCDEMMVKQNEIEGLLLELALRENQIIERSKDLDMKEKLVDEHCMAEELRAIENDERCCEIKEKDMELERREGEISERLSEIELKQKKYDELMKDVELKQQGFSEQKQRELERREGEIGERLREIELKQKNFDELMKDVELKQKGFSEQKQRLVLEENRISRLRMELERRKREQEVNDKKLNEGIDSLKAKEREIDIRLRGLNLTESNMIEINAGFEELGAKTKLVEEYSTQIYLVEKLVKEKGAGLEMKEKQIQDRLNALELKEMQFHQHSEDLKLRKKVIEEKGFALELKEKEFNKRCQEYGSREKVISDVPVIEIERLCSDLVTVDDGETLQLLLNDKVDEHGFMGESIVKMLKLYNDPPGLVLSALNGFFPPHTRKGNVVYTARTVRSSCLLLLEQLMNVSYELCENVRVKAEEVSRLWKQKMEENGENRIVVLGFLLLLAAFRLTPLFEKDELKRLWEIVDHHRLAPLLRFELDLFEECQGNGMEIRQLGSSPVVTDDTNLCSDSEIQSGCSNMDANGLTSYLRNHVMDHKLFPQKLVDALKCAPDPAMLVFKVLQTFNLPQSSIIDKTCCIFLLEQLMKLQMHLSGRDPLGKVQQVLSPPLQISQDMRIKALTFASRWKQRLTQEGLKPLEVYGFLQFVASYKLASLYDEDELFQLFKVLYDALPVYCPEKNPHLCRALGLTKKVPDLIKSLIKEDRRLQAAKYICTFMEEPHFPLALLLKDHVQFIQQRVDNIRGASKDKRTEKTKAMFELSNLRDVLRYINDYKLEQEFSPTALESRIIQLEAIMSDLKVTPTEAVEKQLKLIITNLKVTSSEARKKPIKQLVTKNKIDGAKVDSPENLTDMTAKDGSEMADDSGGGKKRDASSLSSAFPQQEKRLKVEAVKSPVRPNITFKIPSAKSSFFSEKPQAMVPRQVLKPCLTRPSGHSVPSEHPAAKRLELSPTTKSTSTPGAVYSLAVAPYGGGQTQNTP